MLNIFDPLLSIMQTDNYVYFFLPIDIYTVLLDEYHQWYQR